MTAMNKNIQMIDFKLNTFESNGSFPEVSINARVVFPVVKGISSIDTAKLKQLVVEAIYATTTIDDKEGK